MDDAGGRAGSERFKLGHQIVRRWRRESDGGGGEEENEEKEWGRHWWIGEDRLIARVRRNWKLDRRFPCFIAETRGRSKRSRSTQLVLQIGPLLVA